MKEIIKKNLKIIIPALITLLITSIIIAYFITQNKNIEEADIELEQQEIKDEIKEEIKKIKIDIKGEVKKPGVYELEENDRVSDAIKISGGLTENADTELINLSKTLKDEMVIIIYNKYEIEEIRQKSKEPETIIKYIEKKCTCPDTTNDACIKKEISKEEKQKSKISINTGSLEELMQVEGIGESKAKAIIKYREENGPFETIEDITKVSGIGESTFEKFKNNITI